MATPPPPSFSSSSCSFAVDMEPFRSPFLRLRSGSLCLHRRVFQTQPSNKTASKVCYSTGNGILHSQALRYRIVINEWRTSVVLDHTIKNLQIDANISSLTSPTEHIADVQTLSGRKEGFVGFFLQEGFSRECTEKLVKKVSSRRLDGITVERVESLIRFLKSMGMDVDNMYRVLLRFSGILCYDVDSPLRRNALSLVNYGLNRKALIKLIEVFPRVLVCSLDYLNEHLEFIENFSGTRQNACKVIERYPLILKCSVDQNLRPKLDFFTSLGTPGESSWKFLVSRPQVFGLSIDRNFLRKMEFFVGLGFERNSTDFVRASLLLSTLSCELLQSRFNNLMELGLSHDEAIQIVRKQPDILGRREEEILKKVDYLLNVMHRTLGELVKLPAFLSYSLENRIKYRYEILREWKADGALGMDYSLGSILVISNRDFHKKFAECSCERLQGRSGACGGRQRQSSANISAE